MHWAGHARLERLRGRTDDARKVYRTVTTASLPSARKGAYHIWWDWAEMEWLSGNAADSIQVISQSVGEVGTGRIATLRVKNVLQESIDQRADWKEREACTKLKALLELLTTLSPSSALAVFDAQIAADPVAISGSVIHESLTVASSMMIYHHGVTLRNAMPPSILRDHIFKAMQIYSSNSVIFGLFLEAEKGQGVWGRVRALHVDGDTCKDVYRRVEEVWLAGWEQGRWEAEKERTRAGLAAAVDDERFVSAYRLRQHFSHKSSRTRGSYIIRRVYLEFLIRGGQLQQAKAMLYLAIGECPLHKGASIIKFVFEDLKSSFRALHDGIRSLEIRF